MNIYIPHYVPLLHLCVSDIGNNKSAQIFIIIRGLCVQSSSELYVEDCTFVKPTYLAVKVFMLTRNSMKWILIITYMPQNSLRPKNRKICMWINIDNP